MLASDPTIGSWSQTVLTKFIRDLLQNQPPGFLPSLKAEDITVTQNLILKGSFAMNGPGWRSVGASGNAAFANSWVNFGSSWQLAQYRKDAFGVVYLRGLIKSGVVGSPAFTLPPGWRPPLSETFPVSSNYAFGAVDVLNDGSVTPKSPSVNTWVSLSGISFQTT